ncbi:MAG: CHASE2 domain-containing protein, partial [Hydrogenophaga sp.]|nr:CHASE2 domain-containing protein [Hydrogenophaga sp.]
MLAVLALLVGLLVAGTPLGALVQRPLNDLQARLLAPERAPARVLVVDIDEPSLAALQPLFGPWPWRRDVYALAVDRLRALGARAVALDVLMTDPRPGDEALARALTRPGAPVVLAAAGTRHASDGVTTTSSRGPSTPATGGAPRDPAFTWPHVIEPAASIRPADSALPLGVITGPLDEDGVLRHLPAWHRADHRDDARWPTMPLAMLWATHGPAAVARVPLDAQGRILLTAPGPEAHVATMPFSALFEGWGVQEPDPSAEPLAEQVAGSAVFIGSSALLADTVMTLRGQTTGTQALAQTYAALRDERVLRPVGPGWQAGGLALALLPLAWAWRRGRTDRGADLLVSALVLGAATAAALAVWTDGPWLLPLAGPLATWSAGAAGLSLLNTARMRRAQRRLHRELALAEAAAQAKTEFLTTVSHEMRTPLNALLGVAELLDESPLTREQRRQVGLFRDAGHGLLTLINDLLDLSKIEAGKLILQPGRVEL